MPRKFDRKAFEADVKDTLERNREAFKGQYAEALKALAGLSQADIDAISPSTTAVQKYFELIAVVKEASRVNLAQKDLKRQITKLGSVAVKIAKKIPSLAAILA